MPFNISDLTAQGQELSENFFADDVDRVAIKLIGAIVVNCKNGLAGQIIDTEAYCYRDPAAHCFQNKKERERLRKGGPPRMHDAMYGPAGNVYIYPGNGDWCALNFVCGVERYGAGILIRAIKSLDCYIDRIRALRKEDRPNSNLPDSQISAGPLTVCRALRIRPDLNKTTLTESRLKLFLPANPPQQVIVAQRVRVSWDSRHGDHLLRRYIMTGMKGFHCAFNNEIMLPTDDSSVQQHAASIDRRLSAINPD